MKLISRDETDNYVEIVIEHSFLCFKTVKTYRKYEREALSRPTYFQYKSPNDYRPMGFFESQDIRDMFKIKN